MATTQLIKPENKKFFRKLENLKKEIGMKIIDKENMKQIKFLTKEQIEKNPFLTSFLEQMKTDKNLVELVNSLELKRVFIGDFGRKAGYVYRPIKENYFRFVIHIGSPEIYYKDSKIEKDKQIPMMNGVCLVISPYEATDVSLTVYPDPIRLVNNHKVQDLVPKIRPKDYKRTVLIYDFEYNLPE